MNADRIVPWLTVAEAARHLGISPEAFHKWLSRERKAGHPSPVKVHWFRNRMRFRQTDLDRCVVQEGRRA